MESVLHRDTRNDSILFTAHVQIACGFQVLVTIPVERIQYADRPFIVTHGSTAFCPQGTSN
jgi:hypothetical protein